MSEDDKKSPQGFGANSAVFVALFATGAYFYAQQAPLTVLRPPPMESRIEEKFHAQDVEARLWQDPFDTVAREIKRVDPEEKRECEDASTKKAPTLPLHCRSPLVDEGESLRSGTRARTDHRRHGARRLLFRGRRNAPAIALRRAQRVAS